MKLAIVVRAGHVCLCAVLWDGAARRGSGSIPLNFLIRSQSTAETGSGVAVVGACREGACREGACGEGACRKEGGIGGRVAVVGACREGACREGACCKEGGIGGRAGIGAS